MTDKVQSSYQVISYPANELPPQYINLVFSKWMRSLRYGNDYFKLIDSDSYFDTYNKLIARIFKDIDAVVRIAVLTDDHDVVLGWSVYKGQTLHFVHVHKDMRKQGIGTALTPPHINVITHLTKIGMSIWQSKLPDAIFNPFA